MKTFLVIGDMHGQLPRFHFKDFDAIIAPGDFCSDDVKIYAYKQVEQAKKGEEVQEIIDLIGKTRMRRLERRMIRNGKRVIKILDKKNVPVYSVPGNWDSEYYYFNNAYEEIKKGTKNIIDCHARLIKEKDFTIIGYGYVNGPELLRYRGYKNVTKKEYERNRRIYWRSVKKMSLLFERAKKRKKPIIFICHNVPFNTKLDLIKDKRSPSFRKHFGSLVAKKMIKKYKPLLFIGGHIHENFGKEYIGRTLCINAGFGADKNVLVKVDEGKIKSVKFYKKR